jgi:hypothetical protein
MSVQEVEVSKLVFEPRLYPRVEPSVFHINRLADALRAGETLPPVIADDERFILIDGVHRSRAWARVYGDESKIPCELVTADDAEIFRLAVECNTGHGLALTPFEQTKCLLRFNEFGITREVALRALRMTAEKAERMVATKTAYRESSDGGRERIAIKGSLQGFHGETLTEAQVAANNKCGGLRLGYYVNQMVALVESGLCDRAEGETLENLYQLKELLNAHLPKRKKKKSA